MSLASLPAIAARDVPVATAAQMAEVDRVASEQFDVPLDALMESAARQIAAATRAMLGGVAGRRIAAVTGGGNNGGDALGALRHLRAWGADVAAYVAAARDRMRPLARHQYDACARGGVRLHDSGPIDQRTLVHRLQAMDIVIDGLLGYSAHEAPRGEIARLIQTISAGGKPGRIVAVDIPSGLHPDTGENMSGTPMGAVAAAVTVTLGLPKPGLFNPRTRAPYVGELVLADIGIPAKAYASVGIDASRVFEQGDLLRVVS